MSDVEESDEAADFVVARGGDGDVGLVSSYLRPCFLRIRRFRRRRRTLSREDGSLRGEVGVGPAGAVSDDTAGYGTVVDDVD